MSNLARRVRALALIACCALVACGRDDAVAQAASTKAHERPAGWSSECFGRFVVDVPGRLEFGYATAAYYEQSGQVVEHYGGPSGDAFSGTAAIASLRLTESRVIDRVEVYDLLLKQAEYRYTKDWYVNKLMTADEKTEVRRATEHAKRPDRSYIWRQKTQFDFGTLIESDMRARMLRGELSGQGSLAQAKAVVDALWPRYSPRKSGEMPTGAGICTPYGFFADPPKATERDYGLTFSFPDVRHSNLVLRLAITTHSRRTLSPGEELKAVRPEDMPTPWDEDEKFAKEQKAKCREAPATENSRNLFGCALAGLTNITRHRAVEYVQLSSGQRGRLLVMEYRNTLDGNARYGVRLEVPGEPDSAERPWIRVEAEGHPEDSPMPGMKGKKPPSIEEAISTVRTIAASLRLRPGAVATDAPVKDTLEGIR